MSIHAFLPAISALNSGLGRITSGLTKDSMEVGQDLIQFLIIHALVVAGGLIPVLPGQLPNILALVIDMIKVLAQHLGVTIRRFIRGPNRARVEAK